MSSAVLPNAIARNAMNGSIWWVISYDLVQWVVCLQWVGCFVPPDFLLGTFFLSAATCS